MEGDHIQSLICFFCACVYTWRRNHCSSISWETPVMGSKRFFQYTCQETKDLFSIDAYLARYGNDPSGHYNLRQHMAEFDDWYVKVPFEAEVVRVLCCPEDRVCTPECLQGDTLCAQC